MSLATVTTVNTSITNTLSEVGRVVRLLSTLAKRHHVPQAAAADMAVALDEVLSNIVNYGYTDDLVHRIGVCFMITRDELIAQIDDDGRPFDPLSVPQPDLRKPLAERKAGGLGIHFVRTVMTDVRYARVGDRNRLVMRKSLVK